MRASRPTRAARIPFLSTRKSHQQPAVHFLTVFKQVDAIVRHPHLRPLGVKREIPAVGELQRTASATRQGRESPAGIFDMALGQQEDERKKRHDN